MFFFWGGGVMKKVWEPGSDPAWQFLAHNLKEFTEDFQRLTGDFQNFYL